MSGPGDDNRPYKLPRPRQLEELSPDQVVAVVLRLAMEVTVLRDRLRTHEQLLAEKGLLTPQEVEDFSPSKDEADARRQASMTLVENLIGDLSE